MSEYAMTIGGEAVSGLVRFPVLNPATGEVVAEAPACTRQELDAAVAAAEAAFPAWRADKELRRSTMLAAADAIEAAGSTLGPLLTAEQGKSLTDSAREIMGACIWLRWSANYDDPPEIVQDDEHALIRIVRRPLGPVAAIVPWNFPVMIGVQAIAPALSAGNTVVLKPSPFTPLATLELGRVLAAVLPPGVVNIVSGGDELGAWMTAHPGIKKIHFTGSVATGKKVAMAAAADLKRMSLELGGNDAAIILDDVEVDKVAERLFWSAFTNNGQICIAIKRIYAPASKYDELVGALAEIAKGVKVGDGAQPGTQLGPVNNRPQFARVAELVADALHGGAVAAAGGAPIDGPGNFFEPTILANVEDGTRIVDEEQFGPALPVVRYTDVDDAVARANATHFGLGASVWTEDLDRGADIADRLESGMAWVNSHMEIRPSVAIGGVKWSGLGVAFGRDGYRSFTEQQMQHHSRRPLGRVAG